MSATINFRPVCIRQFNLQKRYGKKDIQNQSKVRLRRTGKSKDAQPTGGGCMKQEYIYRVEFKVPPLLGVDDRKEFYFHSLAAIYDTFTAEQIGCKVTRLWNIGVSDGNPYDGRRCRITKEPILRKTRNKRV